MTKSIDPIDRHVGGRIRMQRLVSGMSQTTLGDKAGITFQQIQKYENGKNCVSAGRIQQFANVFKVPPEFFFDGASAKAVGKSDTRETAVIEAFISSREGIGLSKAFSNIRDAKTRRSIVSLVQQLAQD